MTNATDLVHENRLAPESLATRNPRLRGGGGSDLAPVHAAA